MLRKYGQSSGCCFQKASQAGIPHLAREFGYCLHQLESSLWDSSALSESSNRIKLDSSAFLAHAGSVCPPQQDGGTVKG